MWLYFPDPMSVCLSYLFRERVPGLGLTKTSIQCVLVITLEAIQVMVYFGDNLPSLDPTSAAVFTLSDTHSKNSNFHALESEHG